MSDTNDDELAPAYLYCDSGPYGRWWAGTNVHGDGFGDRNNHMVPKRLLNAVLEGQRMLDEAEDALDIWRRAHR